MDALPPALTELVLRSGVDFTVDTLLAPAAVQALQCGDATAVRAALGKVTGTDQRRMVRMVTGLHGPAVLDTGAVDAATLARRHAALTLFHGGLPGLLLLSGQDLAGTLEKKEQDAPSGWSLYLSETEAPATRQGHARAATLYPPVPQQLAGGATYANAVRRMTAARQHYGLARARMLAPALTKHTAVAGVWLALPQGGHALILANFSSTPVTEQITLPTQISHSGRARDVLQDFAPETFTKDLTLELAPYACRWLLME